LVPWSTGTSPSSFGAALLFISIVATDISSRLGVPLLLVFLGLGMLAGEDDPGGIQFDDFNAAYVVGTLALAVGGRLLLWLINRLALISGLYPLLDAAGGLVTLTVAAQLGGSGFLAIYLTGLILGNSRLQSGQNILRVHDGPAWLSQIVIFVILGLLLTPSQLVAVAPAALAVSAFLMLVARPAAVFVRPAPLNKLFDPHLEPDRLEAHRYFGDFALNGDAEIGEVATVYGLAVPEDIAGQTLAEYLNGAFHGRAVVGDRAPLVAAPSSWYERSTAGRSSASGCACTAAGAARHGRSSPKSLQPGTCLFPPRPAKGRTSPCLDSFGNDCSRSSRPSRR